MKKYPCLICEKRMRREKFYPDKSRATGVSSRCIECKIAYEKTRIRDRRAYFAKYKKDNPEKIKAKWKVAYAVKTG